MFPRMSSQELKSLDVGKSTDKEWFLLRNEPGVKIKTIDDIGNLSNHIKKAFLAIRHSPLKGAALGIYSSAVKLMYEELQSGKAEVT